MKGTGCYRSFLEFSLVPFFVSRQRKEQLGGGTALMK
jgi:hypothetical protein